MKRAIAAITIWIGLASGALADPSFWRHEFPLTDFERTSVQSWLEVRDGGPGRDGIPALENPTFEPVRAAKGLAGREPVIALELEGAAPRAYPLRYLTWHEIVNDTVDGLPVAVTFCPLCNSAPVFDRRVGGQVLTFGVTGKLRHSDMIMYDHETESWWQQALGQGIVGAFTGTQLVQLPSWTESWASFAARNPDGLVMAEPDLNRGYGRNPYAGYDSRAAPYSFYTGEDPPHGIAPLARVVRVGNRAWPLTRLADEGEIREAGVVLSWAGVQASALDTAQIASGRDVGAVRVQDSDGRDLAHDVMFAFAYHALYPEGQWMLAGTVATGAN